MARELSKSMEKRGRVYYANFMKNGRRIRKRLASDRDTAERLLTQLKARLDAGDFGLLDANYSWASLKAAFLGWAKQGVRSGGEDYRDDLEAFEKFAHPANVREVTPQRVYDFRAWRLSGASRQDGRTVSPRTVNRQVGTLKHLFAYGVQAKLIGSSPIEDVAPLDEDEPKKVRRALSVAEVEALFNVSPPHLLPVWRMFLTTGARRDEVVHLLFSDIDFEGRTATLRAVNTKNHKTRQVPLDDATLATMAELKQDAARRRPVDGRTPRITQQQHANFSQQHVFVTKANTPWRNNLLRTFYKHAQQAGIEGACVGGSVDVHSLRGSFVTLSIEHGGSPKAVQGIVGHKTLAMTMNVYAKATESGKREAVACLPFATVSQPSHLLKMPSTVTELTQVKKPRRKSVG